MVFAYLRVSTKLQHTENQKQEIERFAASKNITIDRWVMETSSGKKAKEERELGALLPRIKEGDVLIVTELSRLSRTLLEIMSILNRCMQKRIIIYSTKDGYSFDNSLNSKVLAFAFGLVAEIEHNLISLRTREALAARRAEGQKLGRPNGTSREMEILRENRDAIIYALRKGSPLVSICRKYEVSVSTFRRFRCELPKNLIQENLIQKNLNKKRPRRK